MSLQVATLSFFLCTLAVAQTTTGDRLPVPEPSQMPDFRGGPLARYSPSNVPQIRFSDSDRLNTLIRAGNIYLSLRDAIALAIENNLDVEFQRLTPLIAETDLQRARAGGVTRGVAGGVREGPTGLGSGTGGQNQQNTGISATAGSQQSQAAAGNQLTGGLQAGGGGPSPPNLDPTIVGTLGWGRSNRPQTNTFITGTNAITSTSSLGDLRLQQGFLWGGVGSLGFDASRADTNNLRADINPATSGGLAASYVQPLLRGFGFAVNNRFIRIARNNQQVSDLLFEQQVITTAYTVARLYWDLVSLNGELQVQRQSLDLAGRLLNENVIQEQAGTLAPIEIVRGRAEVARARRDLTAAETRVRQQETILKDYLTRRSVDITALAALRVIPTDTLTPPDQDPVQPLQDLVAEARRRRPDLVQAGIQVENSRISLTGSRSALLPELDLVVNARTNTLFGAVNQLPPAQTGTGTGGNEFTRQPDPAFIGGLGTGLSQVFGARFPDYNVQLQLNIPILNRAARADYARDQLNVRQQEIRLQQTEKQLRVDVVNALIAVEQSRSAFDAARQAREFQEQSLEAERQKYAVGVSTNYLVIQYQRDLAQSQSAEVAALADYAKARAALDRATGTLLDRFNVSIVDAFRGQVR